jgi:ribosomal protein S27E
MPQLGELKKAREIGFKGTGRYIWVACLDCGKERWVYLLGGKELNKRCRQCAMRRNSRHPEGDKSHLWKGGKIKTSNGYIGIKIYPNDFFYPMAQGQRYVIENRLIMAKHLGRCLQKWELVHHKNGIKDDNRIENLELTTKGSHTIEHNKGYRDGYDKGYRDGKKQALLENSKEIYYE